MLPDVNAMRAGFLALLVCTPCFAHHGVAPHYDVSKPVRLKGKVARFEFINPHSFVYVDVVNAAGATETWTCELASRTVLSRNGLSAQSFKPGAPITIDGVAARHNATGCAFRVAHFADGSTLESTALFGPTVAAGADLPADAASIVGVWAMKRFAVSDYRGALTEAGERARAAFDPIKDDPAIYCDPASPVRFWVNVNEPFEIARGQDAVVIEHRFMDSRRVVHLSTAAPADAPRGTMGWSIGRFEGAALVVTTDHFTAATLEPRYGVLHTQDLKLTERLAVNATGELEISWVIDDPAYFKQPVTQTEVFVRSRRDPEPYDCKPGYRQ